MKTIQEIKEWYNSIEPFKTVDDIPDIPVVPEDIMYETIIPNLIRCGAIPKDQLIIDVDYEGSCRNSEKATWKGDHFEYKRYKHGFPYIDEVNHFEDDDGYDVFVPIKRIN